MIALIDGDIVAYRCAASLKIDDALDISNWRAAVLMKQILEETGASEYILFLSGGENFRKTLYPLYKANREGKPRPPALEPTREYLVLEWNAKVTDGIEADDALGIAQMADIQYDNPEVPFDLRTVICSIDKDLLMIPGKHYNFVKKEFYEVSQIEALRIFYKQMLLGDRSDNVPGYDGMPRQKSTKLIEQWYREIDDCKYEWEMYEIVKAAYNEDEERIKLVGNLLYIQQKENDTWKLPHEQEPLAGSMRTMAEEPTLL